DAGPPPGLSANRRAVSPLRTTDPPDRRRWSRHAFLFVVPAPAGRRSARGPGHPAHDVDAGPGRQALDRAVGRRGERRAGGRRRNLTIGLLAQESHFDAAFMAAPDLRAAVRHGGARLEAMAEQLATLEREGRVQEAPYANLQHEFEVLGGYTLDQRVDEAL